MNNSNKVQIIIDSSTDLPERLIDKVKVVPLTVMFGEEELCDGVEISRNEFYEKLESGKYLPTTSQPSPAAFEEVFSEIRQNSQEAIVITISSVLSGTYASACIAAENYPEVRVIDSRNVTIGAGVLAEYALRCADEGMSLNQLATEIESVRDRVCVLASLDTLDYLVRGGRISKTAGLAGGVLNIKPVITVKDGAVHILGKARGPKKANNFLIELVERKGVKSDLPILLGYTGTSDKLLQNYIKSSQKLWEGHVDDLEYAQVCSVIGVHAGPGAVAVAFFKE